VSEACHFVEIKVLNKSGQQSSIGVRTVEATAKPGKDYISMDQKLEFKNGEEFRAVKIEIVDDEQWNEDREFQVELYEIGGKALQELDTRCNVLIIDDDKPGNLAFESKKGTIRHVSTIEKCVLKVVRTGGADGQIKCRYRTRALKSNPRSAEPDRDFIMAEGLL